MKAVEGARFVLTTFRQGGLAARWREQVGGGPTFDPRAGASAWRALLNLGPAALGLLVLGLLVVSASVVMGGMDRDW